MDDLGAQGQPRGREVEHSGNRGRLGDDRDDELRQVLEEDVGQELPSEPNVLEPAQRVTLKHTGYRVRSIFVVVSTGDDISMKQQAHMHISHDSMFCGPFSFRV